MTRGIYIAFLCMSFLGYLTNGQSGQGQLARIEISLGKSPQSLKGVEWSRKAGTLSYVMPIQDSCEFIIRMPSGKRMDFKIRSAALYQENLMVNKVTIRPMMHPIDYQEAITKLESLYSEIMDKRDPDFPRCIEEMKKFKPTPGWPDARECRVKLENGVDLSLSVEAIPKIDTTIQEGGWLVSLDFTMSGKD